MTSRAPFACALASAIASALFAFVVVTAAAAPARAGVMVNFSGGSGSPLTISLPQPVQYTLTNVAPDLGPFFILDGVGNLLDPSYIMSGSITFSVNGGPASPIINGASASLINDITPDDTYIWGALGALTAGDVVTLSAGSVTSVGGTPAVAPPSGVYESFVSNNVGTRISQNAVPAPEPAGLTLLATTAGVALLRRGRRRHRAISN